VHKVRRGRRSKVQGAGDERGIEFYFPLLDAGLAKGEAKREIIRTLGKVPRYRVTKNAITQDYLFWLIKDGVRLPPGKEHPESTYRFYARLYALCHWKAMDRNYMTTTWPKRDRAWLRNHWAFATSLIDLVWKLGETHDVPPEFLRAALLTGKIGELTIVIPPQ
jgi:hypothetical protein